MLITFIFKILYTTIITEKSKNNYSENEDLKDYLEEDNYLFKVFLLFFTDFFLSIPLAIFYNYFIILFIIISIPFNFIPLKYYLNIIISYV